MVQAILAGRKVQTRRVVKDRLLQDNHDKEIEEFLKLTAICPYGQPGDVLWVRETWQPSASGAYVHFKADCIDTDPGKGWKPSIHMPKDACRLFLRITNVRVERLQSISEQDAVAEGIKPMQSFDSGAGVSERQLYENYLLQGYTEVLPKDSFCSLWASINGEQSWRYNPWVWVIEFERMEGRP